MHLSDELVQRLLAGEETNPSVRNHVADCPPCQALVERAQQDEGEILELLQAVDVPPPGINAEMLVSLARVRRQRPRPNRYRWAALFLVACLLGGVAYALPGSPLKTWLSAILGDSRAPSATRDSAPGALPSPPMSSGVALDPGDMLAIVFLAPPPGARTTVILTDDSQVVVQAPIGEARFTAEANRLLISIGSDSTVVVIRIPRAAPRVEILADARRLLTKTGPRIVTPFSPPADTAYLLPLAPPQRGSQ